jgi:hypothetical protein
LYKFQKKNPNSKGYSFFMFDGGVFIFPQRHKAHKELSKHKSQIPNIELP